MKTSTHTHGDEQQKSFLFRPKHSAVCVRVFHTGSVPAQGVQAIPGSGLTSPDCSQRQE